MNSREQFYAAALENNGDELLRLIDETDLDDSQEEDPYLLAVNQLFQEGNVKAVNAVAVAYARSSCGDDAIFHYDKIFQCCEKYGADMYSVALTSALPDDQSVGMTSFAVCGVSDEDYSRKLALADKEKIKALYEGIKSINDKEGNLFLIAILFLLCQVFDAKKNELSEEALEDQSNQPSINLREEMVTHKHDLLNFIIARLAYMSPDQQEIFLNYCLAVDEEGEPRNFVSMVLHSRREYTFLDVFLGNYTDTDTVKFIESLLDEVIKERYSLFDDELEEKNEGSGQMQRVSEGSEEESIQEEEDNIGHSFEKEEGSEISERTSLSELVGEEENDLTLHSGEVGTSSLYASMRSVESPEEEGALDDLSHLPGLNG